MDTLAFFRTVIPSGGTKFLVEWVPLASHPKGGIFIHRAFTDFETMAEAAAQLDAKGKTVYHACASYKEAITKTTPKGKEYIAGRTQANALSAKALWQDLDVGKLDDKGELKAFCYATTQDAVNAVKKFTKASGFPTPLYVSSGNGLHIYWPFKDEVPAAEWVEMAQLLRLVMNNIGTKFDPSRDSDVASILRPVGTHNKTKEVRVVRDGIPHEAAYYKELLLRYIEKNNVSLPTRAAPIENELGSGPVEFPQSSIALVADRCNQIKLFRDTGGESEPIWYAALGVSKHCTDGEKLAHEWGAKYSGYSQTETQAKLDQWQHGPTTCEKFRSLNAAACADCPFSGTVKSPIQLGYMDEEAPPAVPVETVDGITLQASPDCWPRNFRVLDGVLNIMLKGEEGELQPAKVAAPLFYLDERIEGADGTFVYKIRMNVRGNQWREFEMPAKNLAEMRAMKSVLASYEIIVYNDKLLGVYMNEFADALRRHKDEVKTFKQFGWTKDSAGYLLGNTLLTAGGRVPVRVSRDFIKDDRLMECAKVKGTKDEWAVGVKELYNRPHGEPYQYAICTQFGAPLVELIRADEWNGIPLALTSTTSGYGKSTVSKIGINAIYQAASAMVSDTTPKAFLGRASVMNNLPFLVDEITKSLQEPKDVSDVLYALSNGRGRIGMTSDGKERDPSLPFKVMATITGNENLWTKLTQTKTNPEALQMRVFEIDMADYPTMDSMDEASPIHSAHHELATHLANHVHGVWADDYFEFVFKNRVMIEDRLQRTFKAIVRLMGSYASKERFFAYHMATTLVGGWIGVKIGALDFNINQLKDWAYQHVQRMRGQASEMLFTVEDKFSEYLNELHGAVLVTKHYDLLDGRANNIEVPMLQIKNEIKARLVLGSDKERGKLFVSVRSLDEWCAKHKFTPAQFKRELAASGMLNTGGDQGKGFDRKMGLSKGVPSHPMGQCRCLEIDFSMAQGYIQDNLHSANVVGINKNVSVGSPAVVNIQRSPTSTY